MYEEDYPVVYFDLDDTFLLNAYAFQPAIEQCLHLSISIKEAKKLYHFFRLQSERVSNEHYKNGHFLTSLPKDRWRKLCEKLEKNWTPSLLDQLERVYKEKQARLSLTEDAKRLLEKMRQCKIEIGIITNGGIKNQMKKYNQLQLYNYISEDKVYVSEAVGFSKPESQIFSFVGKNIPKKQNQKMYYIGDSLKNDVYSVKGTNWQPIWFNYLEIEEPKKIQSVRNMNGIYDILFDDKEKGQ